MHTFIISCACLFSFFFFFSSRRRHTRSLRDWSSDVCSSDLPSIRLIPASSCQPACHFCSQVTQESSTGIPLSTLRINAERRHVCVDRLPHCAYRARK